MKEVFVITKGAGDKSYWNKVGIAYPPNKDGSVNIQLFALPVDGKLQIREPKPETT
jgi:hypothetical protein